MFKHIRVCVCSFAFQFNFMQCLLSCVRLRRRQISQQLLASHGTSLDRSELKHSFADVTNCDESGCEFSLFVDTDALKFYMTYCYSTNAFHFQATVPPNCSMNRHRC